METVRRFAPEFWNMFPSAQNFSSNFSELFKQYENDPSAWPDDILYKPFNPFWARPNDGKFYKRNRMIVREDSKTVKKSVF